MVHFDISIIFNAIDSSIYYQPEDVYANEKEDKAYINKIH